MIIGIVGAVIFGVKLVNAQTPNIRIKTSDVIQASQSSPSLPKSVTLPHSIPTHLSIPAVTIDADIVSVGQNSEGSIELPPVLSWQAGWYKLSPTPGELGPAIIVGHLDSYQNISVFWRLRDVQSGDKIYISREDGKTALFEVTGLNQYSQDNFPTQQVYGNLPYAGLRLITCGGVFNKQTGHYSDNIVVSAKLIQ